MQLNLNSKKIAYDIIDEVCRELLEENATNQIDPSVIYGIREEWTGNFENYNPNQEIEKQEEFDNLDNINYSDESDSYTDEDPDIKRAEEESKSYALCLFVKVTKSKGKWKCIFKDGFVNIDGSEDVAFNNATGELEW